jgi:hypothetical protein
VLWSAMEWARRSRTLIRGADGACRTVGGSRQIGRMTSVTADDYAWIRSYEDGELRTTFDGTIFRGGSTPDALLS